MAARHAPARKVEAGPLILERFVPYRLSVLANTVSRAIAREYQARFGLSIPEWRVLAVLGRFAPLTASGVSTRTEMDKVRVSRAVARLLKADLIERRTDPEDRRRGLLSHTRAGADIYRRIVPLARGREAALIEVLSSEEVAQLDRLLDKLQRRADRIATTAGGPRA
ncbi:MAG: MarR family winged helix-turn-helix transcriptional regulator [Alphaproteobacteria bacterium]